MITTMHNGLDQPELRPLFSRMTRWPLVSISHAQRRPVSDLNLNWIATVYNGLDLASTYSFGEGDGGYFVFLGRIAPEKNPVLAIQIAIQAGVPIKIAARVDPRDEEYFESQVRPLLSDPLVDWIGEQDDRGKNLLLGSATALLMPVDWDEPFGLTFIEALACGTPVISSRRGSLPEIVRDGVDGFLCDDVEALLRACHDVVKLDRRSCRQRVLERFSSQRMVEGYEHAYTALVARDSVAA